MKLPIFYCTFL